MFRLDFLWVLGATADQGGREVLVGNSRGDLRLVEAVYGSVGRGCGTTVESLKPSAA